MKFFDLFNRIHTLIFAPDANLSLAERALLLACLSEWNAQGRNNIFHCSMGYLMTGAGIATNGTYYAALKSLEEKEILIFHKSGNKHVRPSFEFHTSLINERVNRQVARRVSEPVNERVNERVTRHSNRVKQNTELKEKVLSTSGEASPKKSPSKAKSVAQRQTKAEAPNPLKAAHETCAKIWFAYCHIRSGLLADESQFGKKEGEALRKIVLALWATAEAKNPALEAQPFTARLRADDGTMHEADLSKLSERNRELLHANATVQGTARAWEYILCNRHKCADSWNRDKMDLSILSSNLTGIMTELKQARNGTQPPPRNGHTQPEDKPPVYQGIHLPKSQFPNSWDPDFHHFLKHQDKPRYIEHILGLGYVRVPVPEGTNPVFMQWYAMPDTQPS